MSISDKLDSKDAARTAIELMVKHTERQVGSREVAYGVVAGEIRMSSSWVKKSVLSGEFIRRPHSVLMLNIKSAYERLCESIEQQHRAELKHLALIKGEISAATAGLVEPIQHKKRNRAFRTGTARAASQAVM